MVLPIDVVVTSLDFVTLNGVTLDFDLDSLLDSDSGT